MKNISRRLLSAFLACVMVVLMAPVSILAFAACDHSYSSTTKLCTSCGKVDPSYTGLLKNDSGEYIYYYKGVKSSKTAFVTLPSGSKYYKEKTVYLSSGKVLTSYTGLKKDASDNYWYVVKGIRSTKTGIYKMPSTSSSYKSKKVYLSKGKMLTSYTGLKKDTSGNYWYVVKGVVSTNTGLYKMPSTSTSYKNQSVYIKSGKFITTFTGLVKKSGSSTYYYVKKGVYSSSYNGTANNTDNTYFANVKSGKATSAYSGVIKSTVNSKYYYVKSGKVDTTMNGGAKVGSTIYKFKKGVMDSSFTGAASYNGTKYYFEKGQAKTSVTGLRFYMPSGGTELSDFRAMMVYKGKVVKTGIPFDFSDYASYTYNGEYYSEQLKDYIMNFITVKISGVGDSYTKTSGNFYSYSDDTYNRTTFTLLKAKVSVFNVDIEDNNLSFQIDGSCEITDYAYQREGRVELMARMYNPEYYMFTGRLFSATCSGYIKTSNDASIYDVDFALGTYKLDFYVPD